MSNSNHAKAINIPLHLRGRIEHAIAKNNNTTLIDTVVAPSKSSERMAEKYLKKQRERVSIERLPRFEQETATDIKRLRQEIKSLYRLIVLVMVILLTNAVLGGVLCLL